MPGVCRASSLYSFFRADSCKTASLLPLPHIVTNAVSFVDGLTITTSTSFVVVERNPTMKRLCSSVTVTLRLRVRRTVTVPKKCSTNT